MAQFDVHATTGRNTAGTPFVVIVQSARYDGRSSRVVIPLVVLPPRELDTDLVPSFRIERRDVHLNPLGILTVPTAALGRLVGPLADDVSSNAIIKAIDTMISRGFG